ncbi:MAG: ABC transporter substrate-binding protein, partial [Planctomycetota bacterium]
AAGIEVHVFNHRTVAGILRMVRTVGAMVGCPQRADDLANRLADGLDAVRRQSEGLPRPRVYFEEWDDPIITSIGWVAELVDTAGGEDLFAEQSRQPLAKDRVVADASAIVRADPDLIIASWCGKRFDRDRLESRPGWSALRAVQLGDVYAIDSSILLQPGPAALTDGVRELRRVIAAWQARSTDRGRAAKPAAATP